MRYLIFGASGYFGREFARQIQARGDTPLSAGPIVRTHPSLPVLCEVIAAHAPDWVINAAAYTGRPTTSECETNRHATWAGNVEFPYLLGETTSRLGLPLLHLSTGCLYQYRIRPYQEWEPLNLQSPRWYTVTKYLSDTYIQTLPRTIVARVRLPFDHVPHPRNLLTKLLGYPEVLDATNSLSHLGDAVQACLDLTRKRATGPFNVVCDGGIGNADILQYLRAAGFQPPGRLVPVLPHEPTISECVLSTDRLQAALNRPIRPVAAALGDAVGRYPHAPP